MLSKNEIYETVITDYTAEGQGIAHIEGCAVFIPNAIAGERVRVRIETARKTWAAGKITEILDRSPHRCNRECPVAKLCGGCDFWHMDYEEETRLKAERVRTCLNRMAGENLDTVPILAAPTCHGYRNKAQYPLTQKRGRAYAGFFRAGTHEVVENDRCRILPLETDVVKDLVMDYVNKFHVSIYDETTHKGLLRHIYVRRGAVSGQILVCLVGNGVTLPKVDELLKRLKTLPGFTTLVLSVNTKKGNAVLGDQFITLYGPGYIEDTLCGLTFRLSPRSFYQVNHDQAQRLYEKALEYAGLTGRELAVDLYCGAGTITQVLARRARHVIGGEIVPEAIRDAEDSARRNGVENVEFLCGDASRLAAELRQRGLRPDVICVDPPRKGLAPDVVEAAASMTPGRIVYVSCDPATLARDVARFAPLGYCPVRACAVDLFPGTAHVETVCLLSKPQSKEHIEIEVKIDELDLTSAESKATYEEIREYVLEHTGLKVSHLYIAQVKQKYGIIERENYNKPKSDDARQPQCPPEKEEAITEALRHFGMI